MGTETQREPQVATEADEERRFDKARQANSWLGESEAGEETSSLSKSSGKHLSCPHLQSVRLTPRPRTQYVSIPWTTPLIDIVMAALGNEHIHSWQEYFKNKDRQQITSQNTLFFIPLVSSLGNLPASGDIGGWAERKRREKSCFQET